MSGVRLFVDDIRDCPPGWIPARTITEAIRILATQDVEEVSLDHDIQCSREVITKVDDDWGQGYIEVPGVERHASKETFEPVAYYLAATNRVQNGSKKDSDWPIKVRIHTSNKDGGARMAKILGLDHYRLYIFNPEDYR